MVKSIMPIYSRVYFELQWGISSKGTNLRSFAPTIVSKIEYFTGALCIWNEGIVLSVVLVLSVREVPAVFINSRLVLSLSVIPPLSVP